MPTINNATVATGTGLDVSGNGGRKLVRLSNGWFISGIIGNGNIYLYISKDSGTTWSQLCYVDNGSYNFSNFSLQTYGNKVYLITALFTNAGMIDSYTIDALTQGNVNILWNASYNYKSLVSSETALGATSLAINDAGTELHAAWSSKNSTYPNSFNIRYAKGTIAADGSVTWGAVEQVTKFDSSTYPTFAINPSITLITNIPLISVENNGYSLNGTNGTSSNEAISVFKRDSSLTAHTTLVDTRWTYNNVYKVATYKQASPVYLFVPQSINGLANGRLWVAWHGKDATESTKFNIRTSYSDDGGVTWAAPTKQTTGNTYDQMNASLTADAQGKVLLTWDAQNATTTQTALKVFNGTWGATMTLTGDGYTNVSTLFDNTFKLGMTTPPLTRQSTSGVYFSGNYFTGASVSPAPGALGDKTVPSVLSYTVTPESGSTIASIVEKVNGTTVNTYSNPASLSRTFTIPLANWDALKYYNTHTISVTVTDSNGMANTQTYTFNKALANDASLLEGTKAAKDGKDRISTKRDGIAGQVGLPAGSTFDAISAAISSNLRKTAAGTVNSSSAEVSFVDSNGTVRSFNAVTVSGIGFTPSAIMVYQSSNGVPACSVNTNALADSNGFKLILRNVNGGSIGYAIRLAGNAYITNGTFQMPVSSSLGNTPHYWFAIE